MTAEEQRQIDAEARRAALRSMESMGDISSRAGAAVAPALPPSGFDENGIGPIDMQPAAEPATPAPLEAPNRDHLGNIDPSSGSVFGPDFPETEAAPHPYSPTFPDFDGRIEPGNIDLHDRPIVHGSDGSYSTLLSSSADDPARGEVLYPGVSDDGNPRIMGDDEAWREYQRTGQHLGVFGNAGDASAYAERIHREGDAEYGDRARGGAARTSDPVVRDRVMGSSASQPIPGASALADPRAPSIVRDRLGPKPPMDAAREAAAGPLPTLDAGLPSEADIAGAREGVGDSFLRHLQNGLRGAIGMPTREAPTTADDLASERRAGIRAGMERKGVLRSAESTAAASADRQSRQDDLAQARLGLQERSVAAQEAQIPSRIAATEAGTARTQAQTESAQLATQFSRATREERQSAESQLSRGYQQAIEATLRGMGPTGARFREGLTGPLDTQSAEQLEPLMRRLQSAGMRTTGAGGGTGGAPPVEGGSLAEQYVAHGISEDTAQAQAEIAALGGPDSARAQQRLATRMDEATPPPPTGSVQANIAAAQGAADEIQSLIARSGRDIPGIGRLDALVPTVALSEEGRRMRALVLNLSDNYLRMVSGAAIPTHEIESFAERLGASDEPIFREQVARIQREIARRQTGSAASPASATHRRPRTQAPESAAPSPAGDDFSQMSDEELRAIAGGG